MLSELISSADIGDPVWLPDLRERFAQNPDTARILFRLRLITGEETIHEYDIPRWKNDRERQFVAEYFYACIYNLLSACSGQNLTFSFDAREKQLTELVTSLETVFQLREKHRCGYGKVISIADRLCTAFGLPPFRFYTAQESPYLPASVSGKEKAASGPLRVIGGVDIGGTDIKFALSLDGNLAAVAEYDWNPAESPAAEGILNPIVEQLDQLRARLPGKPLFDALGISFPDIVIDDRILGGETPKTEGMRRNLGPDYEQEFRKISNLQELLRSQCRPGAPIRIINDGNMAAFTAAQEFSRRGLVAHTLGTDLGTGWLLPDGTIPPLPLELYDVILDLGSRIARAFPARDLRSTRNENSGLPGTRRYLGQAAAFRLAQELDPDMLADYRIDWDGCLQIQTRPQDLRKACLEHLINLADSAFTPAEEVFRRIGQQLGVLSREMDFLLRPETKERFLYGRFFKNQHCFELIRNGCAEYAPEFILFAPDENTAVTPLMKQLTSFPNATVAQYAQAIGAIHYASV